MSPPAWANLPMFNDNMDPLTVFVPLVMVGTVTAIVTPLRCVLLRVAGIFGLCVSDGVILKIVIQSNRSNMSCFIIWHFFLSLCQTALQVSAWLHTSHCVFKAFHNTSYPFRGHIPSLYSRITFLVKEAFKFWTKKSFRFVLSNRFYNKYTKAVFKIYAECVTVLILIEVVANFNLHTYFYYFTKSCHHIFSCEFSDLMCFHFILTCYRRFRNTLTYTSLKSLLVHFSL